METKNKLKNLMKENNIKNLYQLSLLANIPYTTLRNINDTDNMRTDTAKKICNFFNISLDELIYNDLIINKRKTEDKKMNDLIIFENKDFGKIRTLVKDNEPWFVATDICKILGLTNTSMAVNRLDEDERYKFNLGRQGNAYIVNEYGLYNLILASRKPEAKDFKRWITHEVIPAIRKTGGYMINENNMTDDELIQKALIMATNKLKERERQLKEQEHKVLFADSVTASETSILIRDMAKLLKQNNINVGEKRLFQWLRDNGYLIKSNFEDRNSPTQKSMNLRTV